MKKVLVFGYGSVGKRHEKNLLDLGIRPFIYDIKISKNENKNIIDNLESASDIEYCIISTPTAFHYQNFLDVILRTQCKKILIEKPIEMKLNNARTILDIADKNNVRVRIAYNLRYLYVFDKLKEIIKNNIDNIRIVKITCGQYLPDWRPNIDYKDNYSAHIDQGGGVDLDLSHEIDYMIWLFGIPKKRIFNYKRKISSLDIDASDYFKGIYDYGSFIVDLELDYIRKIERNLRMIGENKEVVNADFISKKLIVGGMEICENNLFNINESYQMELEEFLGITNTGKLCTVEESIKVLELLEGN